MYSTDDSGLLYATLNGKVGGQLRSYDTRTKSSDPIQEYNCGRDDVYAVEEIGHSLLLGFEGGELQLVDRRMLKKVCEVWDPYVTTVGDIEYNGTNGFLTSGLNE